jgi:single-strand DNA-binding protein
MARSLNRIQLIGNLTRDPELRYTPNGAAVCTFGLATNRSWTTDTGEKKEEVEFHRIVAWSKLAELCSQLLAKGRKVYLEGRIAYRKYTDKNNIEQNIAEIVIDDMLILDSKRTDGSTYQEGPKVTKEPEETKVEKKVELKEEVQVAPEETMSGEEVADDIPF